MIKQITTNQKATPVKRIVRAVLKHLNGTESEVSLTVPMFTNSIEPSEKAAVMMRDYVFELSKYWVQISSFKTYIETLMSDGQTVETYLPQEHIIPTGKIYDEVKRQWVTPQKAKALHLRRSRAVHNKHALQFG